MSEDPKTNVPAPIQINERGQMVAKDNAELVRMVRTFMKGMAFPKTLDTEEKILAAWQVATSLGLPPAVAMQNMAVINGSVAIWGQLPKALAEATGQLEVFRQFFVDATMSEIKFANKNLKSEAWACVVQIKRKGRQENEYFFSLDDARKAKLLSKSGPWTDHTRTMLARRTIGQAIKFEFPAARSGTAAADYDLDAAPDLREVNPGRATVASSAKAVVDNFMAMFQADPNIGTELKEAMNAERDASRDAGGSDTPSGREDVPTEGRPELVDVQVHSPELQDELAKTKRRDL